MSTLQMSTVQLAYINSISGVSHIITFTEPNQSTGKIIIRSDGRPVGKINKASKTVFCDNEELSNLIREYLTFIKMSEDLKKLENACRMIRIGFEESGIPDADKMIYSGTCTLLDVATEMQLDALASYALKMKTALLKGDLETASECFCDIEDHYLPDEIDFRTFGE